MGELLTWLKNHKDVCVSLAYFGSEYLKVTMHYKYNTVEGMFWEEELDVISDVRLFLLTLLDNMYNALKGEANEHNIQGT